jgi:hypothetical protein
LFCVLFVCKCLLPLGDNPIEVNKYIITYHEIVRQVGHLPELCKDERSEKKIRNLYKTVTIRSTRNSKYRLVYKTF